MPSPNKEKGNRLERDIRLKLLKYWPKIQTARLASRLMDNCKIDLVNLPLKIQCKSGYERLRPKYESLYEENEELCKQYLMGDDPVHNYPYILIHKLPTTKKKAPQYTQVTMTLEFFLELLDKAHDRL